MQSHVACRQLGYPGGAIGFTVTLGRAFSVADLSVGSPPTESRVMYFVRCRGGEARVQDCVHSARTGYRSGRTTTVAGVVCRPSTDIENYYVNDYRVSYDVLSITDNTANVSSHFLLVGGDQGHEGDLLLRPTGSDEFR